MCMHFKIGMAACIVKRPDQQDLFFTFVLWCINNGKELKSSSIGTLYSVFHNAAECKQNLRY